MEVLSILLFSFKPIYPFSCLKDNVDPQQTLFDFDSPELQTNMYKMLAYLALNCETP